MNLNNLFYGDIDKLSTMQEIVNEIARFIQQNQGVENEELFLEVADDFKAIYLLMDNSLNKQANLIFDLLFSKLTPLIEDYDLEDKYQVLNLGAISHAELSDNSRYNFTILYHKFVSLFNLFTDITKNDYVFSRRLEENIETAVYNALPVELRPDTETVQEDSAFETTHPSEQTVEEFMNQNMAFFKAAIRSNTNDLLQSEMQNQEYVEIICNMKQELSQFTSLFLSKISNDTINIFNLNALFTHTIHIQKIHLFLQFVLNENLLECAIEDSLRTTFEELDLKLNETISYPFSDGQGFVRSIQFTKFLVQ